MRRNRYRTTLTWRNVPENLLTREIYLHQPVFLLYLARTTLLDKFKSGEYGK